MWLGLFQYIHSTPSFPAAILMMQLPHNISNFRFSTLYFPPVTLICLDFLVKKGHHCFSIFCIQNCLESFATVLSFTSYQRMQAFNTNNMDKRLQWKYCDMAKFSYNYNRKVLTPKKKCKILHLGGGVWTKLGHFHTFFIFFFHVVNHANLQRNIF